jgi:5-methylcytosine-specific restriction protein A
VLVQGGGLCAKHKAQRQKELDQRRGTAAQRGYSSRWQRYRLTFLQEHPLCVQCKDAGLIVSATVVDHVTPHRGDYVLMWDPANHQALCKPCHDRKTAIEDGGFGRG